MRAIIYILCCLPFLLLLPSLAVGAPSGLSKRMIFGLSIGLTLDEIDARAQQIDHGVYATPKVPKTDKSFKRYSLVIGPTTGLCKITAVGKTIPTKPSGKKLIKEFEKMRRKLEKKCGVGETQDFVEPGSTYDSPEQFMMSLREKDRKLETRWYDQDGSKFKADVEVIVLKASATRTNKGFLTLEYVFTNYDECMVAIDKR